MIFRQVATSRLGGASRYTGYRRSRIFLTLECGHEQSRKASEGCPNRARCRDCERTAPTVERFGTGLVKIDGLPCTRSPARQRRWLRGLRCAWSGKPIHKGDECYRPLMNGEGRAKRWLASEIDALCPAKERTDG